MIRRPTSANRTENSFPTRRSPELQHDEIELGVSQKRVKARAVVVPRGEDQAAIGRDPRLDEAELVLGEDIAVHLLALHRRADEAAVGAERPAVIDAAVGKGVAGLRRADAHPAMRANVQRYVDLTAGGARYDDLIVAKVAHNIVAGHRTFGVMRQHEDRKS